jgi:hypothetical protein
MVSSPYFDINDCIDRDGDEDGDKGDKDEDGDVDRDVDGGEDNKNSYLHQRGL